MVERVIGQSDEPRIFADEETKWGFEVAETVSKLFSELPSENPYMKTQEITFEGLERKQLIEGLSAVFTAGTVIGTNKKGVVIVPERTIGILKKLEIPFNVPQSSSK